MKKTKKKNKTKAQWHF